MLMIGIIAGNLMTSTTGQYIHPVLLLNTTFGATLTASDTTEHKPMRFNTISMKLINLHKTKKYNHRKGLRLTVYFSAGHNTFYKK